MKWLEHILHDNTLVEWLTFLAIVVVLMASIVFVRNVLARRLRVYARRTTTTLDDLLALTLAATRPTLLLPVALYIGAQSLTLPATLVHFLSQTAIVVLLVQSALWGNRFISEWVSRATIAKQTQDAAAATTMSFLGYMARVALWVLIFLLTLDNLGFNITTLLAGLGIGGVAVALAAQNILSDLFASLSIVLDKPFVIGDFIVVGDFLGTVEHIGVKTTRIRSLGGEQIVFSNTDLLGSRIKNYKRMQERRVLFGFGVIYQTTPDQLAAIPGMVRDIIQSQGRTRFDRAHFKDYGDSSLNFEVVYYVLDSDYNVYMDIQQSINLALYTRFQRAGIEFAYPTRTLYITPTTQAAGTPAS
jgi:small-conductance mechanosensitive channel